jgi:membrane protease YdiL (CAAX protease family)
MFAADFDNPWIVDVRQARRRPSAILTALAGAGFAGALLVASMSWGGPAMGRIIDSMGDLPQTARDIIALTILDIVVFGALMAVAFIEVHREGRPMWRRELYGMSAVVGGLAFGFGGFCASTALASLAGAVSVGAGQPFSTPIGPLILGLVLTMFQSIAEETYFRGWLQPVLCASWGPWLGLLATSVLFAGLHIIAGAHGVLAVVNLLLGGMLFGLLALRSGGLAAPAAAHFAWNWTESGILGLDIGPTGRMFDLRLHGQALWSGGADTMNGSLAMTIVLSALVLTLLTIRPTAPRASIRRPHRIP